MYHYSPHDRVYDQIAEAVEASIDVGLTPERFKELASSAWADYLRERLQREPQRVAK